MSRAFYKNIASVFATKYTGGFLLVVIISFTFAITNIVSAQDSQSLEIGEDSAPSGTANDGPGTTVSVELLHNINNPSDDNFTTYLPTTTATVTFSNQEYSSSQDSDNDNSGNLDSGEFTLGGFSSGDNPALILGWTFNGGGTGEIRTGDTRFLIEPFDRIAQSQSNSANYSSIETEIGDGINDEINHSFYMSGSFEALRGQTIGQDGGGNVARYLMGQMTITFPDEPVTDPILHFYGLGGRWFYSRLGFPTEGQSTAYINSATLEFDLDTGASSTVAEFVELSGTDKFEVDDTNKRIRNNALFPDVDDLSDSDDFGVGSGSALIRGDGITTLVFDVYVRGMNGDEFTIPGPITFDGTSYDQIVVGNEAWGWAGGGTDNGFTFPDINFPSDAIQMSISTQVQPDETLLTGADCYRMLSSPVEGTTYGDLIGDFWIQGQNIIGDGVDHTDGSTDPNVFVWPTSVITGSGSYGGGWAELLDLDEPIEPGTGFLISVFEDDDYETSGIQNPFDKEISVTGSENTPTTVSGGNGLMNNGADDFSLLGNPFKSSVDFDALFNDASNVYDVVYIWNRASGEYETYTESTGMGDITDGLIAPFQGFFVQASNAGPEVVFSDDVKSSSSGTFFGKEKELNNFVRLELNGESLTNSVWLSFSENGSQDRTLGDALELTPLTSEYAMLGTRKTDGTIFDIGHYPIPNQEFEIPVSLETTRSGRFTINATDLDLSFGADLYFIDLETEESIRIDENFSYEFSTAGVAAKSGEQMLDRCRIDTVPQKAKTIASADRFMIATSPKQFDSEMPASIALNQNYPNPFNPTTQISYELPQQSDVRLEVYDLVGRQVATLVNETMEAGAHTVNFNATNLSSGVYIYRLNAGNNIVLSRKLTVIK